MAVQHTRTGELLAKVQAALAASPFSPTARAGAGARQAGPLTYVETAPAPGMGNAAHVTGMCLQAIATCESRLSGVMADYQRLRAEEQAVAVTMASCQAAVAALHGHVIAAHAALDEAGVAPPEAPSDAMETAERIVAQLEAARAAMRLRTQAAAATSSAAAAAAVATNVAGDGSATSGSSPSSHARADPHDIVAGESRPQLGREPTVSGDVAGRSTLSTHTGVISPTTSEGGHPPAPAAASSHSGRGSTGDADDADDDDVAARRDSLVAARRAIASRVPRLHSSESDVSLTSSVAARPHADPAMRRGTSGGTTDSGSDQGGPRASSSDARPEHRGAAALPSRAAILDDMLGGTGGLANNSSFASTSALSLGSGLGLGAGVSAGGLTASDLALLPDRAPARAGGREGGNGFDDDDDSDAGIVVLKPPPAHRRRSLSSESVPNRFGGAAAAQPGPDAGGVSHGARATVTGGAPHLLGVSGSMAHSHSDPGSGSYSGRNQAPGAAGERDAGSAPMFDTRASAASPLNDE